MISKKLILPVVAIIAAGGILTFSVSKVNAQTNTPLSDLVQAIAKKFNLDQTQVQTVVDQYRQTEKQNMAGKRQQSQETRLAKLVNDGKITETQKQAIIVELTALKAKYGPENLKNMTPTERRTQMQNELTELNAWAKSQGLDPKLIMMRDGFGFKGEKHQVKP